jgi:uncharacterized membrane protein
MSLTDIHHYWELLTRGGTTGFFMMTGCYLLGVVASLFNLIFCKNRSAVQFYRDISLFVGFALQLVGRIGVNVAPTKGAFYVAVFVVGMAFMFVGLFLSTKIKAIRQPNSVVFSDENVWPPAPRKRTPPDESDG